LSFGKASLVVSVHLVPLVVDLLLGLLSKSVVASELHVLALSLLLFIFLIFLFARAIVVDGGGVEIAIHISY